jgi:hypothetical protein
MKDELEKAFWMLVNVLEEQDLPRPLELAVLDQVKSYRTHLDVDSEAYSEYLH